MFEWRSRRKNGELFWNEVTLRGTRIAGQDRVLAVVRDVSERRRAEEALKESDQFNQQIVANAQEGIIVYDRDLRYKVWNPFMERLTGLPAGEVLGKRPAEVFPFLRDAGVEPPRRERWPAKRPVPSSFSSASPRRANRAGFATLMARCAMAAAQIIGVIGIVRDITERKRAEQRIAAFSQLGQRLSAAKAAAGSSRDHCGCGRPIAGLGRVHAQFI